ncbi:DUF3563 domain-containing protein [Aureimonas frigidaquae]|nr:DUF3563 domain-containing protein [Aureimonas frigidaquae]
MVNLKGSLRRLIATGSRARAEADYLDTATSLVDLELRQREIARGRFRR